MRNGRGELDIAEPVSADALLCNLNAAAVAYHPFMFNAFILTAVALPVFLGSEDRFAEKPFRFRTEGTVVNSFCFLNLAAAAGASLWAVKGSIRSVSGFPIFATGFLRRVLDLIRRGYFYGDAVKCRVHQSVLLFLALSPQRSAVSKEGFAFTRPLLTESRQLKTDSQYTILHLGRGRHGVRGFAVHGLTL